MPKSSARWLEPRAPGCRMVTHPPHPMTIIEIILAILLPPVAVFMRKGAGKDLVINLVLWILLLGIGGIIHAFWLLSKKG